VAVGRRGAGDSIPSFVVPGCEQCGGMDEETKRAIGLFRFGVLGPLVSARLEHGDRREHFEAAARHDYVTPDGRVVRISARTIESWYYAYRSEGLAGLTPHSRADCGTSRSMSAEVADLVLRAKREKPRRSALSRSSTCRITRSTSYFVGSIVG